jgi:hypothetical protein
MADTIFRNRQSYTIYAEPLDGAVDPSQMANAIQILCRNATADAGWAAQSRCVVPVSSSRKQYLIV